MMTRHNISQKYQKVGRVSTTVLAFAFCIFIFAPQALADAPKGMTVENPWMRFIIPDRPAAGYLTLKNDSDADVVMTGVTSPACGSIMIHQSLLENGVASMQMVDSVTIPAHGHFDFAPNGYHLMCMDTTDALQKNKTIPLTLEFKGEKTLTVDAKVNPKAEK